MKSTQAMRDRCRELSKPDQDDYDRAVVCVIDDLEAILKAASELADGFERRAQEPGMGFVVPFPEAIKLLEAAGLVRQSSGQIDS